MVKTLIATATAIKNPRMQAIGRLGGLAKVPKGFATMPKRKARKARKKGGENRWKGIQAAAEKAA